MSLKRIKNFTVKVEEYLMLERSLPKDAFVLIDEGMNPQHPGILKYKSKHSVEELKKGCRTQSFHVSKQQK